jgi:hypothetical protein
VHNFVFRFLKIFEGPGSPSPNPSRKLQTPSCILSPRHFETDGQYVSWLAQLSLAAGLVINEQDYCLVKGRIYFYPLDCCWTLTNQSINQFNQYPTLKSWHEYSLISRFCLSIQQCADLFFHYISNRRKKIFLSGIGCKKKKNIRELFTNYWQCLMKC